MNADLENELIEKLAEIDHDQWMEWSKSVAPDIKNPERVARWEGYWVPYDQLDDKTKDLDREWAKKSLEAIQPYLKGDADVASKELVTRVDASRYPGLAGLVSTTALEDVLASGRVEAHCYSTWMQAAAKLEEAQKVFNQAMQMAAQEDLPVEMKSSLADLVAQVYNVQLLASETILELREVDPGAPPPEEAEEPEEESAEV